MKHAELMNEADKSDLLKAVALVKEGRKLRERVFARLRARAFRRK